MAREETIQFLKDVQKLDFKFPVAKIAELTGFSKSNVSEYLNGKKEPSENFLKTFYSKVVTPQDSTMSNNYADKYIQKLEEDVERLRKENECLKDDILFNLKKNHDFLKGMMAQIRGASLMAAMRSAGNDNKKFEQERRTLGKLIGEALTELTETGKP